MTSRQLVTLTIAGLLLLSGCGRQAADTGTASVPPELTRDAGGKAVFVEFYSPT